MNNATSIATRFLGSWSRRQIWPQPSQVLRKWTQPSNIPNARAWIRPVSASCTSIRSKNSTKVFITPLYRTFSTSAARRRLKPYDELHELGLTFRKKLLSEEELSTAFRLSGVDVDIGNRILKVLQARRVDGTLDIPYDEEITEVFQQNPQLQDAALGWLRSNYPIDEEDAIVRRFAREESPRVQDHPSTLTERGQKLGLYKTQDESQAEDADFQAQKREREEAERQARKERGAAEYYGPQSGSYYAQPSDKEGDPYGRSTIDKIREKNVAKLDEEERVLQEQIDKRLAEAQAEADAKARTHSQTLAQRPMQELQTSDGEKIIRPPNQLERAIMRARMRATTNMTLESDEVQRLGKLRRILPSFLFVATGLGLLYLLTEYWEPPRRSERFMPNTSLAYATCIGILGVNVLVFLAWRFPPAYRILNKYFIVTPGYPYAFSMLGNVLSHQTIRHLFYNMVGLFIFGPALHEDIGRANFLAIYLGAGIFGSLFSFSTYVARGMLYTTSLGASGCSWGITAAYLWVHEADTFRFIFVPAEYDEKLRFSGRSWLISLALLDLITGARKKNIDVYAHFAGMLFGVAASEFWKRSNTGRPRTGVRAVPARKR